ncbi:MAG: hypothetical protein AAGF28_01320 [Pseudomonadota bacterium]
MTYSLISKIGALAFATAFSLSSFAAAEDFSEGSKAKEWGLQGEVKATFSGKVVDVLCELAGDCADQCGAGNRQMGIVRNADNKLIFVLKNSQASFNGAVEDLVPYCNKAVDVDGVMIGDDDVVTTKFYMVQFIREQGAADWNKANLWTKRWKEKNPEHGGKGPWFRRDPRVAKQIAATGHFGIGHEADKKFIEENE